jgi:hypothetical protein
VRQTTVAIQGAVQKTNEFDREIRRAFDGLARTLSRDVWNWKSWGDGILNVGKQTFSSLLEIALQTFLKPLQDATARVLGGLLGGIGGSVGSAATDISLSAGRTVAQAASLAPSLGAGASRAATSAVSGVMGTLGAVGSIGSAISGVIGNFQMAGMNENLQMIEENTRYAKGYLRQIIDDFYHPYLPRLKDLQGYVSSIYTDGLKIQGGAQTVNFTITSNDPRAVAREVATILRITVPGLA